MSKAITKEELDQLFTGPKRYRRAFYQGWDSYTKDRAFILNPYEPFEEAHQHWYAGFCAAWTHDGCPARPNQPISDRDMLNYLDALNGGYTGRVVLRMSSTGRGFRLHETSVKPNYPTVRAAIAAHILYRRPKSDTESSE